jgi:hypothetical protein
MNIFVVLYSSNFLIEMKQVVLFLIIFINNKLFSIDTIVKSCIVLLIFFDQIPRFFSSYPISCYFCWYAFFNLILFVFLVKYRFYIWSRATKQVAIVDYYRVK